MPNFLFWNLNGKNNDASIVRLTKLYDLDILIFAEFGQEPARLLQTLNNRFEPQFHYISKSHCKSIRMFTRFSSDFVETIEPENDRYTMQHLRLTARSKVLLICAHLPSKIHQATGDQTSYLKKFAKDIRRAENEVGHQRTILVGDLNVNPFEEGVVAADGLHATMSRQVARKGLRAVRQERFSFFYNPMWGHFGERSLSPPGTYYLWRGNYLDYFWNMFDQVMVRPSLLDDFPEEDVKILTTDGDFSFLTDSGLPNSRISDHLPIVFSLSF